MTFGSVNVPSVSGAEFIAHTDDITNPHAVTKAQIGWGNVDNTADVNKPISNATQSALNGKANVFHTHAATDTAQDSSHRFVEDSEKEIWNGKANASHGIHVSYSSTPPQMDGTASVGTDSTVARSDHVHPTDTSRAAALHTHSEYASIASPEFTGTFSHNRKDNTTVGKCSVAMGDRCTASGSSSVAIGAGCTASNTDSVAMGNGAIASAGYQLATGLYNYNIESASQSDKFIIGKGSGSARFNCFRVTHTGVYASGSYNSSGADYAELFEWLDGNSDNVDRVGLFVTLDGEKIRLTNPDDDFILGVISGNPSVIGDVYDDQWQGMYLYDIYGRPLWEDVDVPDRYEEREITDENGETVMERILVEKAHTERRQKINPDYDNTQEYQKRTERKEWGRVGMMGKLVVNDDGTCTVNGWAKPGNNGIAMKSETPTKYRVMSRIDDTHIRILIL